MLVERRKLFPVIAFSLIFLVFLVQMVPSGYCATEIEGSTNAIVLIPQQYTVKGANSSETYKVTLTDPNGNSETLISSIKPSSDGEFSFTVTFDEEGSWTITVTSNEDATDTASLSVNVTDVLGLIIPVVILVLIITVFISFTRKIRV